MRSRGRARRARRGGDDDQDDATIDLAGGATGANASDDRERQCSAMAAEDLAEEGL
jgi:hypothetical protein